MKRIVLISFCVVLAACSGSSVPPGKSAAGCTGLSAADWAAIPAKEMGAGGINGVNVKAKMQIPSQLKAPMLGFGSCLLYTSPSPRDRQKSRMPSSA